MGGCIHFTVHVDPLHHRGRSALRAERDAMRFLVIRVARRREKKGQKKRKEDAARPGRHYMDSNARDDDRISV